MFSNDHKSRFFRVALDFDNVRQAYQLRSQLNGKQITLMHLYQCDVVEICYKEENKCIIDNDLKLILQSAWKDLFAFNLPGNDRAEIEFIDAHGMKISKFHYRIVQTIRSIFS